MGLLDSILGGLAGGGRGGGLGGSLGGGLKGQLLQALLGMLLNRRMQAGGGGGLGGLGGLGGALGGVLGGLRGGGGGGLPGAAPSGGGGGFGGLGGLGGLGALAGLVLLANQFRQHGLGDAVSSWTGTGTNQALSPDMLQGALGSDVIGELAQQFGLSEQEVSSQLAEVVPQAVDQATPDGQWAAHDDDVAAAGLPEGFGDIGDILRQFDGR